MSTRTVTSQVELDEAIAEDAPTILIDSPAGVWLTITDTRTSAVTIGGKSCIDKLSGRVGRVTDSGRVGGVTGSGSVGRVTGSGSVDWVTDSGRVERAAGTATDECGAGLHLFPSPAEARDYDRDVTRYLECTVPLADLRPLTGSGTAKCKAPRVTVVREVDITGQLIAGSAVTS